jgi:uncharacterized membrane protein YgdD (TMEM256/DUF423 family)
MTSRFALFLAAVLLLAGVAAGALGAHAARGGLAPDAMAVYQTAVQYHFWHALGLLGVGILLLQKPDDSVLAAAAWLLVVGLVLFSGSLYALALTGIRGFSYATPVGGVALLAAWATLAWAAWRW